MAKITARGCTEVARHTATNERGTRAIFVLRSDGRVLRRTTGDAATGYTIIGRTDTANPLGMLRHLAERYGYTIG